MAERIALAVVLGFFAGAFLFTAACCKATDYLPWSGIDV